MNILLDTHILLWVAYAPAKLPQNARTLLLAPEHSLYFSVASLWEIVIKRSLGREDFQVNSAQLRSRALAAGYAELLIDGGHVVHVASLPFLHKDPFDRLLLAQARCEGMALLTVDKELLRYGAPVLSG